MSRSLKLSLTNLQVFIDCYEPVGRDKTSLDLFWLKDDSLTDLDNLPEPADLADEIIENIEAGLNSFRAVAALLQISGKR
ncbi:hypothetical protein [Luteolibacter rhizosphaerae]|nr:hypothetical protein [Luteolibacter rhizosphaerae]